MLAESAQPLALTERLLHLRTLPILSRLTLAELAAIAPYLRPRSFAADEVIARGDEPATTVHLMTAGRARMLRGGHLFGHLETPDAVGFLPLMARMPDAFEVVAERPTRTLELDADTLMEILEDHFQLLIGTLRVTSRAVLAEFREIPPEQKRILFDTAPPPAHAAPALPPRPLDTVERLFHLRRMRPFRHTSIDSLALVARTMTEVRFDAGTMLWRVGDDAKDVLLLLSGRVIGRSGSLVEEFGPGVAIGGFDAMAGEPRWADMQAVEPVVALRGSIELLLDVFEDDHEMGRDFLAVSADLLVRIWEDRARRGEPVWPAVQRLRALLREAGAPRR